MTDHLNQITHVNTIFFPGLFFYVYIESPIPKKTQKAPDHRPQTPSTENPNAKKNPI